MKEIRKEIREDFAHLSVEVAEISRCRIDFESLIYDILFILKNLSIYIKRYCPLEYNP